MYFKKMLGSRTNIIHYKWTLKCAFATLVLSSAVSSEMYANTLDINDATIQTSITEQSKNKKITGTVFDERKESLIGVSVVIKGTNIGTVTDFDGNFTLNASASDVLQFSYIGFQSISVPVGKNKTIKIVMKEDSQQLDEVVVTGYGGTQLRSKLTASIATLDSKVLGVGARSNPASALAGTISGLRVDQTSGKPGASPKIVLRGGTALDGSGSPLVIIDGIVRSGLNDINPEDIESMQVLKDAAATSIYGARASNGVILVTTKRGTEGKTSITFKAKAGLAFLPSMTGDFLSAEDYISYQRKAHDRAGNIALLDGAQAFGTGNVLSADGNKSTQGIWSTMFLTDENKHKLADGWQTMTDPVTGKEIIYNEFSNSDVAFKNPAVTQDYNVNITGGNKKGGYYAGIGYYDEQGLPINTFYRRLNFTFNGDYKVRDWLTSNSSFSFSNAIWRDPATSNEANYFGRMVAAPPTMRGYNEEGEMLMGTIYGDGNPNYNDANFIRKNNSNKFVFGQTLKFDITKSIYLKLSGTWYYEQSFAESFNKDYLSSPGKINSERKSSASYSRDLRQTYNAVAGWKQTYAAKHNFDFLIGGEYYDLTSVKLEASGQEAPTDDFPDLGLTSKDKRGVNTDHSSQRILSMLGRLNYDFDGKYLAAFSFREDGYSRLLGDNRWGFFPGVSVGWIVGKEDFMESTKDVISFLKVRASYGVNGSVDNIGVYELQGSYKPTTQYNGNGGFNLSELPNPNLRWEKSNTFEVGVDASFLENKITTSFAYYNRLTKDKIANIVLPNSSGWASMRTNNGELRNQGVEIETKLRLFENTDWRWMVSGNISYNKNTVVKLPENGLENNRQGGQQIYDPKTGGLIWVGGTQEGQSPDGLYAYEVESIYRTDKDLAQDANRVDKQGGGGKFIYGQDAYDNLTDQSKGQQIEKGDIRWADIDKNDTIDYRDKTYQGHKIPRWTGGFATDLTYKGFNLYARFDFALGHTMYNNIKGWYLGNMQGTWNGTNDIKETWSEENPNAQYPSYYYADQNFKSNYFRGTSMLYEKASYLCLRDVTLSYALPKTLLQRIGIEAMDLSVTGSNLAYFTNSTLYSPEYGAGDMGGYPLPKTVVFGASLTF